MVSDLPELTNEAEQPRDELGREQAYLAASRAALTWMIDNAGHRVSTGAAIAGDGYAAETLGRMLRTHAKALAEEPNSPLYFGRLDFGDTPAAGDHRGERSSSSPHCVPVSPRRRPA